MNTDFTGADIRPLLEGSAAGLPLDIRPVVTSTNTLLKEEARSSEASCKVMIALEQTAGKGRLGRSFHSPQGSGLYLSILLRPDLPPDQATRLTTVAAVAVAQAMEELTGEPVDLKWVNDVYRRGRKLCGILTEAGLTPDGRLDFAVVGIGINLTEPEGGFPESIRHIAGALYAQEADMPAALHARLAASILNHFMYYYDQLPATSYLEEYRKRSYLLGQDIYVIEALTTDGTPLSEPKSARALAIDDDLRLVVEYPDGRREALSTGEVSVRAAETYEQIYTKGTSL